MSRLRIAFNNESATCSNRSREEQEAATMVQCPGIQPINNAKVSDKYEHACPIRRVLRSMRKQSMFF